MFRKSLYRDENSNATLVGTVFRVETSLKLLQFRFRTSQGCDLEIPLLKVQGGSNMTGTDLCVNKPHCAAPVRP